MQQLDGLSSVGWSALGAAAATAVGAITSVWLGKHIDASRSRDHDERAARVQEREDIRLSYQGIIDRLSTEQDKLWKMFRELQADCERTHREDGLKIGALEKQNRELTARVNYIDARQSNHDG